MLQEQLLLRDVESVPLVHVLVLVHEPATPDLLGGAHGAGLPCQGLPEAAPAELSQNCYFVRLGVVAHVKRLLWYVY